jgi:hypothetical protein
MMQRLLLFAISACWFMKSFAGDTLEVDRLPRNYFRHPLFIAAETSGSFGEVRRLHFHTGIDFKTQQREGLQVLAAADGWISRILVSGAGYGNALYITHPNGYTTVYGHLQGFAPEVQAWVRKEQFARKQSLVDISVRQGELLVRQGEVIALSGNSGGSGGPHLHFEIRDSRERILNPALMGCGFPDNDPPRFHAIKIYPADDRRHHGTGISFGVKKTTSGYIVPDTIRINTLSVAMATGCTDWVNQQQDAIGLWDLQMLVDDSLYYRFTANRFSFDEKRCVCAHSDYPVFMKENRRVLHKCFVESGNHATELYPARTHEGIISLTKGKIHRVVIIASDISDNRSELILHLRYDSLATAFPAGGKTGGEENWLRRNRLNEIKLPGMRLQVPGDILFHDMPIKTQHIKAAGGKKLSDGYHIGEETQLFDKEAELLIIPVAVKETLRKKLLIVQQDAKGNISARKSSIQGNYIRAGIRELGYYYVTIDTSPPELKPLSFSPGKPLNQRVDISFRVRDALSGIQDMTLWVDDEWSVYSYDAKSDKLWYSPPTDWPKGRHKLRLRVTDEKQNETTATWFIYW